MRCDAVREAVSARIDGEDAAVPADAVDRHLAACPACRSWAVAAQELAGATRLIPAETIADQTVAIVAAAATRGLLCPDPHGSRRRWRAALAFVAVVQLALAVPSHLLGGEAGASVHLAHELGSWDVALAVGFLFAAWRPARAWGMLPLVAALVTCLVVTTGIDISQGHARLADEATHALEVVGLGLLWRLARRPPPARRPVLRLA